MSSKGTIRARAGTNLGGASAHNRRVIVDALRINGALSRADLARATRLTKQTISNIVDELEQRGVVRPQKTVRIARGQPITPYELVPDGAFALGLQIDRHVTRLIAVDLVGTVRLRLEAALTDSDPHQGMKVLLELIATARQSLKAESASGSERLVGLGAAMPGPFGAVEMEDSPWTMSGWQSFPLARELAEQTGLQVVLQNDAAAAATAEKLVGAANGLECAICLYLGYGFGAGLILNGELYTGANGNAGEVGLSLVPLLQGERPGLAAHAGLLPLEHRASLASLVKAFGHDPAACDLFDLVEEIVAHPAPLLDSWIADATAGLRWAVHMLESVFDPQTIILSGGAPRRLLERLVEGTKPLLPSLAARADRSLPRLQIGLADRWSVALGAAAEPISRAFDPRFSAIFKNEAP
nr:ROK family transcriptional regulator [uncultured Gellertiella sp.]